jgi:hypothetical protein
MAAKFNPAPHDKHAANPRKAGSDDRDTNARLEAALIDSFPASDPASASQPSPTKAHRKTRARRSPARASASKARR